jgi:hypothetical protein
MNRYPVYIPSKGRYKHTMTAKMFAKDNVPFYLVVEPQEYSEYARRFGEDRVLKLPFSNLGLGSIPARNWIKQHAIDSGAAYHWQFDDNVRKLFRVYKARRLPCQSDVALSVIEDFVDRYENIGIAGLNHRAFLVSNGVVQPPFHLNCHVYSGSLIKNDTPFLWRGRYNEDTDYCLQVLAAGLCTVLVNVFIMDKMTTMTSKGGNTAELYKGDGRLKMARELERLWPGVVSTYRRFQRPQHKVFDTWRRFDTPLKLKEGIDLSTLPKVDEYGLRLVQTGEVRGEELKAIVKELNEGKND